MTFNRKPNFRKATIKANEILVAASSIETFPIKVKNIVKEFSDIQIRTYEQARAKGVDIDAFGSKSAVIQCMCGRYIMFYNKEMPSKHNRFSILHEFGHYICGHRFGKQEEKEYDVSEVEANTFAAQILMPEQVIRELRKRGAVVDKTFLIEHFGVSGDVADKRLSTLAKTIYEWRDREEREFDDIILLKYKNFMDSIIPARNKYTEDYYELDRQMERNTWVADNRCRYGNQY